MWTMNNAIKVKVRRVDLLQRQEEAQEALEREVLNRQAESHAAQEKAVQEAEKRGWQECRVEWLRHEALKTQELRKAGEKYRIGVWHTLIITLAIFFGLSGGNWVAVFEGGYGLFAAWTIQFILFCAVCFACGWLLCEVKRCKEV